MEVLNGSDLMLFIKDGASTKTVAFATSHKVSVKRDIKTVASKDSGKWTDKKAGRMDFNISADYMMTTDETAFSYDDLFALMVAGVAIECYSALATGTAPNWTKGTYSYTGKVLIATLDNEAKDDDNTTFSITLEGTGEYKKEAVA